MYISAESIFSPIVSPRYVETKREAEREIERLIWEHRAKDLAAGKVQTEARGIYVRPGKESNGFSEDEMISLTSYERHRTHVPPP